MQLKVFFLDDELDICDLFKELFSNDSVSITTFNDYRSLIKECDRNAPDLLFVDYRMPDISGTDVARLVNPAITKVLITGDMECPAYEDFVKIVKKPFSISDITDIFTKFSSSSS